MNFATVGSLYLGSGKISLFATIPLRAILKILLILGLNNKIRNHQPELPFSTNRSVVPDYFGFFAPYLLLLCFLSSTPTVSSVPLTIWYLTPGRSSFCASSFFLYGQADL